ncbi:MAG TPA: sulfite exporter TauE/SafE family protein [Bacteroidales bacterium]|nr:sulfite exporter TauE/SafE family protein [Bacteroidales bacterium]
MITTSTLIALSVIIFFASIVRGLTGFGLALVAVPLIQFFMPVIDTAVFIAIVNFFFSILYYRRSREVIKKQPLGSMALFTGIGVAVGTLILKFIYPAYIQLTWGILIIFIVLFLAKGMSFNIKSEKSALTLSGIFGGILAGSTGITGPPVAIILSSIRTPKEKFNAIISLFILFAVTYALLFYLLTGLIRKETVILALCSVPALLAGLYTGTRLVEHISQKWFTNIVYAILIIMGIITILKGLKGLFPALF